MSFIKITYLIIYSIKYYKNAYLYLIEYLFIFSIFHYLKSFKNFKPICTDFIIKLRIFLSLNLCLKFLIKIE